MLGTLKKKNTSLGGVLYLFGNNGVKIQVFNVCNSVCKMLTLLGVDAQTPKSPSEQSTYMLL